MTHNPFHTTERNFSFTTAIPLHVPSVTLTVSYTNLRKCYIPQVQILKLLLFSLLHFQNSNCQKKPKQTKSAYLALGIKRVIFWVREMWIQPRLVFLHVILGLHEYSATQIFKSLTIQLYPNATAWVSPPYVSTSACGTPSLRMDFGVFILFYFTPLLKEL